MKQSEGGGDLRPFRIEATKNEWSFIFEENGATWFGPRKT